MKHTVICLFLLCTAFQKTTAQRTYESDKPGTWVIENRLISCPGQVEKTSFTKSLTGVVDWLKANHPIGLSPKGTDVFVSLRGGGCDPSYKPTALDYGSKGLLYFYFTYFYIKDGKSQTATWNQSHDATMTINSPFNCFSTQLDERSFQDGEEPALKKPLTAALEQLRQYYYCSPLKTQFAPGVILNQDGRLVIWNPDRPKFYLPVTVKEVMEAKLNYYKIRKQLDDASTKKMEAEFAKMNVKIDRGKGDVESTYDGILKQYKKFTPEELSNWAYSSAADGICQVNAHEQGMMIVKFNPAFWNRQLPQAAVQLISMMYHTKTPAELEDFAKRNNQLADYVDLFINGLKTKELAGLIAKK